MFLDFESDVEPLISDLRSKWDSRKSEILSEAINLKQNLVSLDISKT
jgi:hypothetical protein